jgi:hypothetical protein
MTLNKPSQLSRGLFRGIVWKETFLTVAQLHDLLMPI